MALTSPCPGGPAPHPGPLPRTGWRSDGECAAGIGLFDGPRGKGWVAADLPCERGYMVIDFEAVLAGRLYFAEQAALYLVAPDGRVLLSEHYMIYQPLNEAALVRRFPNLRGAIARGVTAYVRITADEPVHDNVELHCDWTRVRRRVCRVAQHCALGVYAKGPELESRMTNDAFPITDLAAHGCPRYPHYPHDPLLECRFFALYVPGLSGALARYRPALAPPVFAEP